MDRLEARMDRLESRVDHLETLYETLELRMNQLSVSLQLLTERVDQGFRSIREDIGVLSKMVVRLEKEQDNQRHRLRIIEERVDDLKKRIDRLERADLSE
jgi:chromosome segregation ATPase